MARESAGFVAVTAGYLMTTTAESLLAPAFPQIAGDLGFGTAGAGAAFAVLAGAIAVGGLAGGFLLARVGARAGAVAGLVLVAAGSLAAAAAGGRAALLLAQVVLGLGSGVFFPSGLRGAASLAASRRRGLAIGIFGIAFSGGLAVAGGLAALGDVWGWRVSYLVAGGLALAGAVGCLAVLPRLRVPRAPRTAVRRPAQLHALLRTPVTVGGVAAASQYGTVAFVPLFAVHEWGLSPAAAAVLIMVARILSVPAKLVSGNSADRAGALRIARRLGLVLALLGAWWTILPGPGAVLWAAVLFAAFVSGLGPVANVLALEGFEEHAELLGAFRSTQIALGAAAGAVIGAGAAAVGLRPVLIVAAVGIPLSLLLLERGAQVTEATRSTPS